MGVCYSVCVRGGQAGDWESALALDAVFCNHQAHVRTPSPRIIALLSLFAPSPTPPPTPLLPSPPSLLLCLFHAICSRRRLATTPPTATVARAATFAGTLGTAPQAPTNDGFVLTPHLSVFVYLCVCVLHSFIACSLSATSPLCFVT
jgi:hypothetical protein